MQVFWIGYALFAVVVLAVINLLMRRQRRSGVQRSPVRQSRQQVLPVSERTAPKPEIGEASLSTEWRGEGAVSSVEPAVQGRAAFLSGELPQQTSRKASAAPAGGTQSGALGARLPEGVHLGPLMAVLMLGMFVAILNQTVLNVAIPRLMNDFGTSANTTQWLMTGFMLVNGVLIPISAFLMETFGTRFLFTTAMVFFTAGSFICGVSPSFSIMLMGRIIQAMGGGIMMPLTMNIFLTIFPPEARGRAMGILGLGMIFAPAVGPTLAGWIVTDYSWRILFFIMVPIGVIDIVLALRYLRDIGERHYPKADFYGILTSVVGFGALLYGFSEAGNNGWGSTNVIISLVIGAIAVGLFVMRELQVDNPMLEFRVFRYDMFTLSNIINAILTMAMFAGMFLLPIYLQTLRGFTPMQAGLLLLPGALIMGFMGPVAGAIFDRIGPRPLAVVGLIITAVMTFQFTRLTATTSYSHIMLLYIVRSFGMSLLMMPIMTAGLNQLPQRLNTHGTAMSNTLRQVAGSIGTAFLTTIFSTRTNFHLGVFGAAASTVQPQVSQAFQGAVAGMAAQTGMPSQQAQVMTSMMLYQQAGQEASVAGINDAFYWATGFTVVALVLSFFLRDVRRDKRSGEKRQIPVPVEEPTQQTSIEAAGE